MERITNDLSSYGAVSITADGKRLTVVQTDTRSGIWLVPVENVNAAREVLQDKYDGRGGLDWVDNNSIVFFTRSGNDNYLSRFFVDRGTQEIIVRGNPLAVQPSVSRSGHALVYNQFGGSFNGISVCDLDGRGSRNLTENMRCNWPDISSDGKWATFCGQESFLPTIMRIPIEGGTAQPVSDTIYPSFISRISPDCRFIAYYMYEEPIGVIRIVIKPSDGGVAVHTLDIQQSLDAGFSALDWIPDGSAILYQVLIDGASNVWEYPLNASSPHQITFFKDMEISDFAMSPDGKTLAVCRSRSTNDVVIIEGFE